MLTGLNLVLTKVGRWSFSHINMLIINYLSKSALKELFQFKQG